MQQNGHEKRLAKIESETAQIKKQIMQLEFQSKKDAKEAQRVFEKREKQIQARFDYLAKLTGISYEELDNLDSKVTNAGRILSREREHSKIG